MSSSTSNRWFATPDGRTIYALTGEGHWTEHQRIGMRYQVHRVVIRTFADRLHLADLLERLDAGLLESLDQQEYLERVSNIERLERLGGKVE